MPRCPTMKLGKLSSDELRKTILDRLRIRRPEIVLGAGVGEDVCAVRAADIIVASTDPITAADVNAGFFAMHVNANDIAASGSDPFAALVTIMLPTDTSEADVRDLVDDIISTADSLNVNIIGGHTEVTDAVSRTVVSVTMLGVPVVPGHIVRTDGMRPDDTLIMTKYAGIEGTMLLADRYADLLEGRLDEQDRRQLELLPDFISVVPEGITAAWDEHVHSMHDITEGGVIGAVQEMCAASRIGAAIDTTRVPVLPVTRKICSILGVDVLRMISSGSMLISVSEQSRLMEELAEKGIPATVIGRAEADPGVRDRNTGELLGERASDAIYDAPAESWNQK